MNTFIKRSMELVLTVMFISTSVVPACAQGKKFLQEIPKAFKGKRPPMSGLSSASLRNPVVPPSNLSTLTGAAALDLTPAVNKALNTAVTRQLMETTTPTLPQTPSLGVSEQPEVILPASSNAAALSDHGIADGTLDVVAQRKRISQLIAKPFENAFYKKGPRYILVSFDPEIDRQNLSLRPGRRREETYRKVIEMFEKCDAILFHKHDGENFIDLFSIYPHPLYEESLLVGTKRNASDISLANIALSEYKDFIDMRNKQIMGAALRAYEISTWQDAQLADPTTQRTAEEIQFLLENLDPQNPLRQALEGSLIQAAQDGYIAPVNTLQVPGGLLNNQEAADKFFGPSH